MKCLAQTCINQSRHNSKTRIIRHCQRIQVTTIRSPRSLKRAVRSKTRSPGHESKKNSRTSMTTRHTDLYSVRNQNITGKILLPWLKQGLCGSFHHEIRVWEALIQGDGKWTPSPCLGCTEMKAKSHFGLGCLGVMRAHLLNDPGPVSEKNVINFNFAGSRFSQCSN